MNYLSWWSISLVGLLLCVGCGPQAPYMRRWSSTSGLENRWSGGTLVAAKLSEDEAAVFQNLGTPDIIRFFRENLTRQRVYEWVYLNKEQNIWFVDGKRVEYVTVDPVPSALTKGERETLQQKFTEGGIVGAALGAIAAGTLLFGESIGLPPN